MSNRTGGCLSRAAEETDARALINEIRTTIDGAPIKSPAEAIPRFRMSPQAADYRQLERACKIKGIAIIASARAGDKERARQWQVAHARACDPRRESVRSRAQSRLSAARPRPVRSLSLSLSSGEKRGEKSPRCKSAGADSA